MVDASPDPDILIPPLRPGATLAVLAPAGPPRPGRLAPVEAWLSERGYRPRLLPSCYGPPALGFLAASDAQRLADLHAAFTDPEVDAVLALRGGYGCTRLLDELDTALLRRHPKLLIGYSDLTALHAVLDREGLPSLHAPMPASDWGLPGADADTDALFKGLARGWRRGDRLGLALPHPLSRGGAVRGRLIGGNLAVFAALVGTRWLPDCRGALLFIEDVSEEPYRIDRLLTQLRQAGVLGAVAGLVLGSFTDAESPDAVLADQLARLGCPVLAGWPSGHGQPNRPLPLGLMTEMDPAAGTLTLI